MTQDDAEFFLQQYRALLKDWTMAVGGFKNGDVEALERKLDAKEHILAEIAAMFPDKAYSVDLLVNARKRTWAGFSDERPQRTSE
jgi:hypothetical protein